MMLRLAGVAKFYGQRLILKEVSLELPVGKVLLLVGNNGSGKSTLLKIIAGLSSPSVGSVECKASLEKIAYLGHQTFIYPALSALENLLFWARLYKVKVPKNKLLGVVEQALARVELSSFAEEKAGTFSRGMSQRLNLARIFLQDPSLILLDEPASGLDLHSAKLLQREIVEAKQRGASVVWISHNIVDDLAMADSVLALGQKRMLYCGSANGFDPNVILPNDTTLSQRL